MQPFCTNATNKHTVVSLIYCPVCSWWSTQTNWCAKFKFDEMSVYFLTGERLEKVSSGWTPSWWSNVQSGDEAVCRMGNPPRWSLDAAGGGGGDGGGRLLEVCRRREILVRRTPPLEEELEEDSAHAWQDSRDVIGWWCSRQNLVG